MEQTGPGYTDGIAAEKERFGMEKDRQEREQQKVSEEMFNSITQKGKPENQNQTHNSRREGMGPNTKR